MADLMVRRRFFSAVSNHDAVTSHPSRRSEDAAPQDEAFVRTLVRTE